MKRRTPTRDESAAVARHVVTAVASGVCVAVALGLMDQEDADKIVEMTRQIGESAASIVVAVSVLLPILSALFAGKSASPVEQVRKVEQKVPGVAVIPTNKTGQDIIAKGTGVVKPIEDVTCATSDCC